MKKICVVTWYSSPNYGTQLQSASLCKYLEEQGLEVHILHKFKVKEYLLRHPSMLISRVKMKLHTKKKDEFFHPVSYEVTPEQQKNINRYISDNFRPIDIKTMDQWNKIIKEKWMFITGSDIIWQPALGSPNKMFLDFARFEKLTRVAYASSTGAKKLPEKYYRDYKKLLKGFKAISTREQNSADFFSELLGRKVYKVIDPTLLHDKDFWDGFAAKAQLGDTIKKEYILCYFVMEDPRYWEYVKKVVSDNPDKQIVVLPMHYSDEKSEYTVIKTGTAYEFINLIKNSSFIVTDSFHAAVFSFIYDKEFYVLKRARSDEDEKFNDLVNKYELRHRIVTNETEFVRNTDTDYSAGKKVLEKDRKFAYNFLSKALELRSSEVPAE
ncbi:MAG: polysaccharide pyruvyl transferase family protein [Ruminococcus sp.]|nr:polysaccharide pyruvyl transferase family protein [Ruminococcus sp.]